MTRGDYIMLDAFIDSLVDSIKLLPFLFITYLIMELIEHKTSDKTQRVIKSSGKFGPLLGGILGIFPQCGFSAAASNLYAGHIITLGTLIAIFLSTSDEMLPILISESVDIQVILKILAIKLVLGIFFGFLIDFFLRFRSNLKKENSSNSISTGIEHLCQYEHCDCDHGIFRSSIKHTLNIFIYLLLISFVLNLFISFIGEDALSNIIFNQKFLGPIIAGLLGLIPNCASSVIITKLYLSGVISSATMISGLLVGSGVGILVLFKSNKNLKQNIQITTILYLLGVLSGIILEFIGLTI